jgi:hypothetical protein
MHMSEKSASRGLDPPRRTRGAVQRLPDVRRARREGASLDISSWIALPALLSGVRSKANCRSGGGDGREALGGPGRVAVEGRRMGIVSG